MLKVFLARVDTANCSWVHLSFPACPPWLAAGCPRVESERPPKRPPRPRPRPLLLVHRLRGPNRLCFDFVVSTKRNASSFKKPHPQTVTSSKKQKYSMHVVALRGKHPQFCSPFACSANSYWADKYADELLAQSHHEARITVYSLPLRCRIYTGTRRSQHCLHRDGYLPTVTCHM